MKVKILGAHNLESRDSRLVSILIDEKIALDAGSITSALSFEEQEKIRAFLITHHHFDHIRDLATFALSFSYRLSTPVYAPEPIIEAIRRHFINGKLYPDFSSFPPGKPSLIFKTLEPYIPSLIEDYTVLPIPVRHSSLTVGYEITSPEGSKLFYTGDTTSGIGEVWNYTSPDLLIIEASLPNELEELARAGEHLTPRLLERELSLLKGKRGNLPPIIAIHLNPMLRGQIEKELNEVGERLGAKIKVASDGMVFEI